MNLMNSIDFEKNYTKFIEPMYGGKRGRELDVELITHEYKINDRYDFTEHETYSIDPDGCEDADDAFSVYNDKDGKLCLVIHIADPTDYIKLGSSIWNDIVSRTTTKYLSNRPPIHMLPSDILKLSSLKTDREDKEKKTLSIIVEIDKEEHTPTTSPVKLVFGKIKIKKQNSYTYKEASQTKHVFDTALEISKAMFESRKEKTKGAKLNELSNAYIEYDSDGVPTLCEDTQEVKKMKQMIAEFAIFANTFVGKYLKNYLNTGIFRTCLAKEWLSNVRSDVTSEDMLKGIIINGIKADYMSDVNPHDLVGSPQYCHFTSPIRRLSDCVCHYLLKHIYLKSSEDSPFSPKELSYLSSKCHTVNKIDKQNQFIDNKFRLIQVMHNMISNKDKPLNIEYYISGYTGLFLNIIICKIDIYRVHMSYTLRIRGWNSEIDSEKIFVLEVTHVNCFTKYDEGCIPELDSQLISI